jgi:hypothetical protein
MHCSRCQHENRPRAKFCEECGASLSRACKSCGAELPAMARFCPECGTPVVAPVVPQPGFASPQSYTPKHLAEKILTSKNALEGERNALFDATSVRIRRVPITPERVRTALARA